MAPEKPTVGGDGVSNMNWMNIDDGDWGWVKGNPVRVRGECEGSVGLDM